MAKYRYFIGVRVASEILAAVPTPGSSDAHPGAGEAERRVALRWVVHATLAILGIGLVVLFLQKTEAAVAFRTLLSLSFGVIFLAVVLYTVAWSLRVWRLYLVCSAAEVPVSGRTAISTALGANALNLLAPARLGDVAAFLRLKQESGKGGAAAAAVVQWRLMDLVGILAFGLAAGFVVLAFAPAFALGGSLVWIMLGGGVALGVLGAAAYWARRRSATEPAGTESFLTRTRSRLALKLFGPFADTGEEFSRAAVPLFRPRFVAASLLLALGAWVGDAAVAAVMLHAAWPHPEALFLVVVPVVAGNVAKMLPTTPGALGVFEAAFAASLLPFGVPLPAAVAAAVATHLLMNAYTLLAGAAGAWATARSVPRAFWRT